MIERLIRWSIAHRVLVALLAVLVTIISIRALRSLPLDAIPDLSDVQVILRINYAGQAPQVIEDQVTYPVTTAMLGIPGARAVRGYSMVGDAFVYIIFADGIDAYWARSRVTEALAEVRDSLPAGARVTLGPDASGVGWIYQYALVDRTHKHDLAALRSLQDWFLRFELKSVPGVAEVATIGGMVRQYTVELDGARMQRDRISFQMVREAITEASREVSGPVIESAEAEYLVRMPGYLKGLDDIRQVPLTRAGMQMGASVAPRVGELADVRVGPAPRRGIAELNGEGEVVGGIVVMRRGENALATIDAVKSRLAQLAPSLPAGVEIVEVYDRSQLIDRAISTLSWRLLEEFALVAIVCAVFLWHARSSLIIVLSLPIGILAAFSVMWAQGINANIMSLGGIAIAIGAMVDAAIVMIENVHKRLEQAGRYSIDIVTAATIEVGRPLFYSLLIITVSFLPVLALEAQEGRLFSPLAYTKTYAMAAAAGISVTLVPALISWFVRGRIRAEAANPLNRGLMALYRPALARALDRPMATLAVALLLVVTMLWPLYRVGTEFMPALNEGDLLYMPTTLPGLSIGKAAQLLQQTDRLIRSVPEVAQVFGKIGRADTATDPAPLTMIETTIRLKPQSEWRAGMTLADVVAALDSTVQVPGLTNAWLMPIQARLDMLATGIRTPVGIKIAGPDLDILQRLGGQVETVLRGVPGTRSVFAERVQGARYLDAEINREAANTYDVSPAYIQDTLLTAISGAEVATTVEGRERYPVVVRLARHARDSIDALARVPVAVPRGVVPLGDLARFKVRAGPEMIRSENARLSNWVYVDINQRDLGSYISAARAAVGQGVALPVGYSLTWSGQYEYLERARDRLALIVPMTLGIVLVLLYLNFRNVAEPLLVMGTLPLALVGGVWLTYILGYNLSVAIGVGLIALAGVAAEFGVVMLVYLDQAVARHRPQDAAALRAAIVEGALLRLRPKAMTVSVIIAGLLPIMFGGGTGDEAMKRIAAPMVGGMITAPLVSLLLIPVLYYMWRVRDLKRPAKALAR